MAGGTFFFPKHLSGAGSTVVSAQPQALLHTVVVGTAGTTVSVYDANATSDTTTPIAVIGAVTGTFIFDCEVQKGIMVVIVGAADVTVNYR